MIDILTFVAALGLTPSVAQEALLATVYGLPMPTPQHEEVRRLCTGRTHFEDAGYGDVSVICGARSGKTSYVAGPIVAYEALCGGHDKAAGKGETPVIPLIACDAKGSSVAFGFASTKSALTCAST